MTDKEKIKILVALLTRLKRHVGLFLKAEISETLSKIKGEDEDL